MMRVVVTGMGAFSCLGTTLDEISQSLQLGRSGIIFDPSRKAHGFRSGLMTRLPETDLKAELDRSARKYMPEQAAWCAIATKRAIADSGLTPAMIERADVGVIVGNDSSAATILESVRIHDVNNDSRFLGSTTVIRAMNSTVSMNLGPMLKAKGINLTISAACASSAHAIGMAFNLIRSRAQRIVFAGGAQEANWFTMLSFDALGAFSAREADPLRACRPFDRNRDGLIPGGGGAMLILESLESAKARHAPILAEVLAYSFSSDGDHLTQPSGDGAVRCIRGLFESGELSPTDIDYINAHATSTPAGDRAEAFAIHEVFGSHGPPVSSTKSMTGHEMWMAGASELVYSLLMMRDGFIAPNLNFEGFDDETPEINVVTSTTRGSIRTVMSNSFGFGGTNACLVVRRFDA